MLLNIVKAKAQNGNDVPFQTSFTLSDDLISNKGYKFLSDISVKGNMSYQNEKLIVNATANFKIFAICDNCGENFEKNVSFNFQEAFVENYNSNNEEDYLINQNTIEIDKPVIDNLLLNIPTKMLCKNGCKGLCSICGKNKNFYSCNCESLEDELDKLDNPFNQLKK